jgi:hypothetical protein
MGDGYQRKTKGVFITKKHRVATVIGVVSSHAHPLKCVVRRLSRRSSKLSNFSEKDIKKM